MKKKTILIITLVILLIVIVASSTYAIYTWSAKGELGGMSECFNVVYTKGQDIGSENEHKILMPTEDYKGGLYASVMVGMDSNCISNGVGTLYLNTDDTTTEYLLTSGALKYQVIENSLTLLGAGTISETGQLKIGENLIITTSPNQYTVVVWLDGSMLDNSIIDDNTGNIIPLTYKGSISMKIESGDL